MKDYIRHKTIFQSHFLLLFAYIFLLSNIIGFFFLAAVVWLQHAIDTHDPVLAGERLLEIVKLKVLVANLNLMID